jgi:putative ABC transport system substrate-binding protein
MFKLFSLVLVSAVAAGLGSIAQAQQAVAVQRIGFLGPTSAAPPSIPLLDVFRESLAGLGYEEGRNIAIEQQWPSGERLDQMTESAAALVKLNVDVIVAIGATAARAAKQATSDIPIVFEVVVNPVATGLVESLERPGRNVTGATTFDPELGAMQIEILRAVFPNLSHVALLGDAGAAPSLFQSAERAAQSRGLTTLTLKVERVASPDFDLVFESAKQQDVGAVIVLSTPVTTPNRKRIAELAVKHGLPTISPRDHADAGGMISYGTSFVEATRHSAAYVDKLLKGAMAAELPVETVRRPELVINLKAARELGVTVPQSVLEKASDVIK